MNIRVPVLVLAALCTFAACDDDDDGTNDDVGTIDDGGTVTGDDLVTIPGAATSAPNTATSVAGAPVTSAP